MHFHDLAEKTLASISKKDKPIKLSSLVANIAKIKYEELDTFLPIFDNATILNSPVLGWFPIHYAAQNSDYRVLQAIYDLYEKNNISPTQLTKKGKNGFPEGCNCMNIAINNISHMCFLHMKNINPEPIVIFNRGIKHNYEMPHQDNLLTYCLINRYDISDYLSLFFGNEYENRNQVINACENNIHFFFKDLGDESFICSLPYEVVSNLDRNFDKENNIKPELKNDDMLAFLLLPLKCAFELYPRDMSMIDSCFRAVNQMDFIKEVIATGVHLKKTQARLSEIRSFEPPYNDKFKHVVAFLNEVESTVSYHHLNNTLDVGTTKTKRTKI